MPSGGSAGITSLSHSLPKPADTGSMAYPQARIHATLLRSSSATGVSITPRLQIRAALRHNVALTKGRTNTAVMKRT